LELSRLGNTAFICNYNNQSSAKNLQENSAVKYTAFLLTGMHLPVPKPKQIYSFMYYLSKGEKEILNSEKTTLNIIRSASVAAVTAVVSRIFPLHCQTTVLPNCAVPLPVWN